MQVAVMKGWTGETDWRPRVARTTRRLGHPNASELCSLSLPEINRYRDEDEQEPNVQVGL